MQSVFGQNGQRALALITRLADLSAEEADKVANAWKQESALDRGRAWAHLSRTSTEQQRYRIRAAASLARREALTAAHRLRRTDWAFWAAASDAAAALAAGTRLGHHYATLTAPLAAVMPSLVPDVLGDGPSRERDPDSHCRTRGLPETCSGTEPSAAA